MKKSKVVALILAIAMMIPALPTMAEQLFSGGSGTVDDPYKIATKADLDGIRNFMGSEVYFVQTADITFTTGETFSPIGSIFDQPFKGSYNGNGYKITNLTISIDNRGESLCPYIGLFVQTNGGILENITLVNMQISCQGDVSYLGSLVGLANGGIIRNCSVVGSIVQNNTESGSGKFGGFIGVSEQTHVHDCYARVNISTDDTFATVGGFIGNNGGTVENSYSVGTLVSANTSPDYMGGFAGDSSVADIINCYYDFDVCGKQDSRGAWTSTVDMKKQATYANWNFTSVWDIDEGNSYPTLHYGVNFLDATVNKDILTLYFSEELKYYSRPPADNFTVTVGGGTIAVKSVAIEDNTIILTLNSAVAPRVDISVAYDFTGRGITDMSENKEVVEVASRQVRNLTLSENANLSSITVNGAELNETFSPDVTYYTAEVENDVTEVTISATSEDVGTLYRLCDAWENPIDGNTVPLYLGRNTFKIQAYSEGVLAEKWYTVVITRKKAVVSVEDAELHFEYTRFSNDEPETVNLDTSSVLSEVKFHVGKSADWIIATPDMAFSGEEITVSFNPAFLVSGVYEGNITIYDANIETVEIPVILNVYNSPVAEIDTLTVENVELARTADTFSGVVADWCESVNIQATALYNGSISGDGNQALSYGMNHLTVTVVSEDGNTNKNYSIDIYRDYPHLLEYIELEGGTLSPEFSGGVYDYTATPDNTGSISIYAETSDEYSDIYWEGDVTVEYVDGHEGDIAYVTNVYITGENVSLRVVNRLNGKTETYNVTIEGMNPTQIRHSSGGSYSNGGKVATTLYSIELSPVVQSGSNIWLYSAFAKKVNGVESINWGYDIEFSDPNVLKRDGDNIIANGTGVCEITVTDKKTNEKLTATVLVEATPHVKEAVAFTDIDEHWAKDYILKAANEGLMVGVGNEVFSPESVVTVEEVITIIDRILVERGKVAYSPTEQMNFTSSEWSAFYIKDFLGRVDTSKLEITDFTKEINREQAAYLLAVALYPTAEDASIKATDVKYIDNLQLGDIIAPYVELLRLKGVMIGSPSGAFNPQLTLTRAEFATILNRVN